MISKTTRTRILFISGTLGGGGAERVTSTLLARLDRSRFAISLCLLRNKISYPIPTDVPRKVLLESNFWLGNEGKPLAIAARRRPWIVPEVISCLRKHIDEIEPDIVVSNIHQINCVAGSALRHTQVRPTWIARLGSSLQRDGSLMRLWRMRTYPRADVIVGNSEGLAGEIRETFPNVRSKVRTIGNPVDFEDIVASTRQCRDHKVEMEDPLIVSMGRLVSVKRFDLLIDAFARFRKVRRAHLCIYGEGPARSKLEKRVAKAGLNDSVSMPGHCDNPFSHMSQASLFVMTSDFEGLPNALIEAQGLGIPAVATRCDHGPGEIIDHGRTGLLVPPGDAAAVAKAMNQIISNATLNCQMGIAAAERMRSLYDVNTIIPQWDALLTQQV